MALSDIINTLFREFKRYTGDGLPGEPTNAPLPVGDPQSGPYSPKKSELRAGFLDVFTGLAENVASAEEDADRAEAAAEAAEAAVSSVANTSFPTRAAALAYAPAVAPTYLRIEGYSAAGDGGGALYKKVVSEPTHSGKFSITLADGVTVIWYEIAEKLISPQMFGAAANGATDGNGTDDAATIQAAIDFAATAGLKCVPNGKYRIGSKVVIKGPFDGSTATFYATGTATTTIAVEVSTGSAANPTDILSLVTEDQMVLPSVVNTAKTGTGWTGFGVGVRYVNVQNMKITERLIENFAVGSLATSYAQGCGYNAVQAGYLRNNKVNRQFSVGSAGGFTNRWDFFGGRYFMASAEGTNVAGTRHIKADTGTGNIINDVNFFGASLEGNAPEYITDIGGNYFQFIGTRWEASGGIRVKWSKAGNAGEGCDNVIAWNRGSDSIVETYDSGAVRNKIFASRNTSKMSASGVVFALANASSSSDATILAYEAGVVPNVATVAAASGEFGAKYIGGKRTGDAERRVYLDLADSRVVFGSGAAAPTRHIGALGASSIASNAPLLPSADNTLTLGASGFRWSQLWAGTATINTSDRDHKQQISPINDSVLDAWAEVDFCQFKFSDAVATKGSKARWHFGLIAQDIHETFARHGLDAFEYGLVGFDEWDAEIDGDGNVLREAGSIWSIRPDECQFLEMALMRREVAGLKALK